MSVCACVCVCVCALSYAHVYVCTWYPCASIQVVDAQTCVKNGQNSLVLVWGENRRPCAGAQVCVPVCATVCRLARPFAPGEDRLAGLTTKPSKNEGIPVLEVRGTLLCMHTHTHTRTYTCIAWAPCLLPPVSMLRWLCASA